ncbi:hypothetical protein F4808DRAFT_474097 [Astrocystis sublimbata]|nr:hypothetical protein F4808DRAFT_474097 [Astrocystis sublimbata]
MGLFRKGRDRSRSSVSLSAQSFEDTGSDDFHLPGSDDVYVTYSKEGKPALGRKKRNNVLQDFGFDILGQTLGVPSRKDYERQPRPLSSASQSSGLITAPVTPRPSHETPRSSFHRREYSYEDTPRPVVRRPTSSKRSPSIPAHTKLMQHGRRNMSNSMPNNAYRKYPPFVEPQVSNQWQHRIPPPPPPPSALDWRRHPAANNGFAPAPTIYYGAASSTYLPAYPYNGSLLAQGPQTWANPQHHMAAQHPSAMGVAVPQAPAMNAMPHTQQYGPTQNVQNSYPQAIPAVRSSHLHPPPPQTWLHSDAMTTRKDGVSEKGRNHVNGANVEQQTTDIGNTSRGTFHARGKPNGSDDMQEYLSKRIQHVHVCAGCGKKRSTRFQKSHPLRRGEIPARNYCYHCLRDAADAICDAPEGITIDEPDFKKNRSQVSGPWPSSDEGHDIAGGKYAYKQSRHRPRRGEKSSRFAPISRLFSRRYSYSSAEESSSRASSPNTPGFRSGNYVHKGPTSQTRTHESTNDRISLRGAKTEAASHRRERYDSVNSWIAEQPLPFVPAPAQQNTVSDDNKARAASDKPVLAPTRTRTRIPRPRPHSARVDIEDPYLTVADEPTYDFDRYHGSPQSNIKVSTELGPTSHLETESISEPLSRMGINDTDRTTQRGSTHGVAHKKTKRAASWNVANPTAAPNVSQDAHLEASANEDFEAPTAKSSNIASEESATRSKNHTVQEGRSSMSQMPSDYDREMRPRPATDGRPPTSLNDSAQRPDRITPTDADEAELIFSYAEPLTPVDTSYAGHAQAPHIISDSWSDYHIDMEREAEEMAERDLAFAGKLFDSLSGCLGGSATSTFPTTSFVTRSNISIVSCHSDSDHSDDNCTATPSIKEAEVHDDVEDTEVEKRIERIGTANVLLGMELLLTVGVEFSSEEELQITAETRKQNKLFAVNGEHGGSRRSADSLSKSSGIYDQSNDEKDEDDFADYHPSPIGSSLIGHTGHSMDELGERTRAQGEATTTANGYRLRPLKRLLSAS